MLVKTEAIVLKVLKHGDSSKIATLHTKSHGLITVIAKGARSNKNKFGSALESLSIVEVTFYFKASRDLFLLSTVETLVPVRKLQSSAELVLHGLVIAESILITQPKNSTNEDILALLREYLVFLNTNDCEPFAVLIKFLLELTDEMGFIADLQVPAKSNLSSYHVNLSDGSISLSQSDKTVRMSYDSINYISKVVQSDINTLINDNIPQNLRIEVFSYIVRYISYHLDKKFILKSASLLNYG